MVVRCVDRPKRSRPRSFNLRTALEAVCIAIENGADPEQMHAGVDRCGGKERKQSEAAEALVAAEQALSLSNRELDADADSLHRFLNLPLASAIALRLIRLIPVGGQVLAIGIPLLRTFATERLKSIAVQRAANDAALVLVRRAAANEGVFLRTGTGL